VIKLDTARKSVPAPIIERRDRAVAAIVCAGSSDAACREAIDTLAARGHVVDYMRVRGFPFSPEVDAFLASHQTVFVVDQNRDGQLRTLLVNDTSAEKAKLRSVRHYSGTPLSAEHVLEEVLPVLEPESAPAGQRTDRAAQQPRLHA